MAPQVIPEEIQENWGRIGAVVISHGHLDHWNLLRFKPAGIPVYCTRLVRNFLEFQARFERELRSILRDVRTFSPGEAILGGPLGLRTFPVPHSVPEALAFQFRLGDKKVVHLGEFKFQGLGWLEKAQLQHHLRKLGEEGVDLLVVDVQNIDNPGFTPSEREALETLGNILYETPGRVIVTCFSSNLERIEGLVKLASILERPVYF